MSIPAIFKSHGEAYFREREAELARRLAEKDEAVIACGGGVILNSQNTRALSKKGVLVSLMADVDTLVKRLKDMEERPLLAGSDLKVKVEALLKERRSIYEEAPVRVSSSGRSVEEVVDEIAKEVSPKLKGPEAA